jgi:hypothetical protein
VLVGACMCEAEVGACVCEAEAGACRGRPAESPESQSAEIGEVGSEGARAVLARGCARWSSAHRA